MRIIKYGDGYPIRLECAKCKSLLEIELGDIHDIKDVGMYQYTSTKYIICPVCGTNNIIEEQTTKY